MKENNDILQELSMDDELLVQQFLDENRKEIADHGFSRRVMRHLPGRADRLNRLWTIVCCALCVVFFIVIRGWDILTNTLQRLVKTLPASDFCFVSPLAIAMSMFIIVLGLSYGAMRILERAG